jgi:transmembrane E3 ubiquitin-protein ligase
VPSPPTPTPTRAPPTPTPTGPTSPPSSTAAESTPAQPPPPPPAPTPTPSPASVSIFSSFVRHIRTDPHSRLCKHRSTSLPPLHDLNPPNKNPGLTMFIFLSFIVRVIISPSMTLLFVGSMYSFFWMPQIIRSARRGRSSGLTVEYLLGTTVCRLYFALCEFFFFFFFFFFSGCGRARSHHGLIRFLSVS